jgi:hypothetical protein
MRTEGEAASPGIAAALEYSVTRPHGDLDAAEKHGRVSNRTRHCDDELLWGRRDDMCFDLAETNLIVLDV